MRIVGLIAATRTTNRLTIRCELDEQDYEWGRMVSDSEMATNLLVFAAYDGEGNCTDRS